MPGIPESTALELYRKMTEIRRPRMLSSARSESLSSSRPSKRTEPATRAERGRSPMIARLVPLFPDFEPQVVGMYAVYASRKHMPATLRTMLDFLAARFTETPAWDMP